MIGFTTAAKASEASAMIGAEIQRLGRLESPLYVCEIWAQVYFDESLQLYVIPYNEIADSLGIEYIKIE